MRGWGYVPGKVSVIIVCWNQWEMTRACLESIARFNEAVHEVVLVDNASTDATRLLFSEGPLFHEMDFQIARLTENVGWGRGANIGAQLAEGEYLLHLNNDTEVHDGWLTPLVAEMADPEVVAVAGTLLNADGTIQHTGTELFFDNYGTLTARNLSDDSGVRDVQCLSLAAALVRADAWNHLGGIDPIFYNGYEDVDWCLRARSHGMRLRYTPDSVVTHIGGASGPNRWAHTRDNIVNLHNRWADRLRGPDGR